MSAGEGLGYLHCILDRQVRRQTAFRNHPVEGLPGDILHDHEVNAILGTDVMDNADVGMLQPGDGFCFLLETRMQVWAGRQVDGQNLNRHCTL